MAQGIRIVACVTGLLLLLALAFSLAALVIPYWSVWQSRRGALIRYGLWQYCSNGGVAGWTWSGLLSSGCHDLHPRYRWDWLYGCCAMMLLCCLCNLIGLILAIISATCRQAKSVLLSIAVPAFFAALSGAIACGVWSAHWLELTVVPSPSAGQDPYTVLRPSQERGLWLAVAASAISLLAFIIALIPVCVDHDAMDQNLPYFVAKPSVSHVPVVTSNGSSLGDELDRHSRGDRLSINGDTTKPIYYVSDPQAYRDRDRPYFVESTSHDNSGYIEDPWSPHGKTFVDQSQPLKLVSKSKDVETRTQFIPVVQGYLVQDGTGRYSGYPEGRNPGVAEGRPVYYIQR